MPTPNDLKLHQARERAAGNRFSALPGRNPQYLMTCPGGATPTRTPPLAPSALEQSAKRIQDAGCALPFTHTFHPNIQSKLCNFFCTVLLLQRIEHGERKLAKKNARKKTTVKKRPIRGTSQQRVYKIRRTFCVKIFSQLSKKIHISVYKICTRFCPDFDGPQTNYIGMQLDRIQLLYSFFWSPSSLLCAYFL